MVGKHAILFVTPFDLDTAAVNKATGGWGFGHVALWSSLVPPVRGQPVVLDASTITKTVSFRPLREMTHGARYYSLDLDDAFGEQVFRRAMRCVGRPYDFAGLIRRRRREDGFTCSGLVCCALPLHLEALCRAEAHRRPLSKSVSPNDIAVVLGVPQWSEQP